MKQKKKIIWIWNHYAGTEIESHGGRHYAIAKHLINKGYYPIVFCASTLHNTEEEYVFEGDFKVYKKNRIPVVVVKTRKYKGNGKERIFNMLDFYFNVQKAAKIIKKQFGKPEIIYASSVHPLTLVAAIKTKYKYHIPCTCEVRDLWPESLIAYGMLSENSFLTKILYRGEKWIYKKADSIIFTMEGGRQYIIDKGWEKTDGKKGIDLSKVFHVNNGVEIKDFDYNKETFALDDEDLNNREKFKCIYAGSIRCANKVDMIVKAGDYLLQNGIENVEFLIYGSGDQVDDLKKYVCNNNIVNVKFKGAVDRKYIPYILSKGNLLLMNNDRSDNAYRISKYGMSLNKSFDYLASGRPILSVIRGKQYDYIQSNGAGLVIDADSSEEYAKAIIDFYEMPKEEYEEFCSAARKTAETEYDYGILTNKIIEVFKYTDRKYRRRKETEE